MSEKLVKKQIASNFNNKLNNNFFIHINKMENAFPSIPADVLHGSIIEWNSNDSGVSINTKCIDMLRYRVKYLPNWICKLSHGCTKEELVKQLELVNDDTVGVFIYQKIIKN
jgi:hypothetical protein